MPIRHSIIHRIDKKPDGSPSILYLSAAPMLATPGQDALHQGLNETYNAKQGKAWGFFHEESGAYPFSRWLREYLAGELDFAAFTATVTEHLKKLLDESNLASGGPLLIAHYTQGMTDYLFIALLNETESVVIEDDLRVSVVRNVDASTLHFAARINLSEWQNNSASRQYISLIKPKGGRRAGLAFRDFIGCQEGLDSPSETRALLKAFSEFIESEDLPEEHARAKTEALLGYASGQAKLGEPITLEELSGLIDEDRPKAFYEHIRNKDYGMALEFPADKRTLNQFRRFTGRADGLSISFEGRLLGSTVEYDKARDVLTIRQVPSQLKEQIKRGSQ